MSSYHKGGLSDLKGVLANDVLRENMLDKISKYLETETMQQ